jgi:hypothetical protein
MNDERIGEADKRTSAWPYFVEAMAGRQYGAEETLDAWLWFQAGFDAAQEWAGYS